jgi:ribose-phosphate pyrophosphokinase
MLTLRRIGLDTFHEHVAVLSRHCTVYRADGADGVPPDTLVVGPDSEARQWVEAIARPLGLDILIGAKHRAGDRDVRIGFDDAGTVAGRPVVLVDDVVSSGATLIEAARTLLAAGAVSVEVFATHALYGPDTAALLASAGIARVRATDSVVHPTGTIPLADVLASALEARSRA